MASLDKLGELLYRQRIKVVRPYIKGRLLDLGCGVNKLVRQYGNGVGVDVFQFGNADIILEDTSRMPFADNHFDTITMLASLNHIPNREIVLREVWRILKFDGLIIITMIPLWISILWHFLRQPWDRDQRERQIKDGEVYGLSKKQVRNLLVAAGFKIIAEKKFMFLINNLTIAKKV